MHSSAAQREVNAPAVEKIIFRGEEKEILSIRRTVLQSQTIFCLELTRSEFLSARVPFDKSEGVVKGHFFAAML
jgi:hypothetical protein